MNIGMLTDDEVLRICSPQSDLEVKLFEIALSMKRQIINLQDQCKSEKELFCIDDLESRNEDLRDAIRSAIDDMDSGKVSSAKSTLEEAL